ncbi:hypothetical protein C8J57DRAFT_1502495 [Mycena rebaudengoi]|nr:hypothetical protein C8J57DRAFT_1502495 [Mycena rebaudengoi]
MPSARASKNLLAQILCGRLDTAVAESAAQEDAFALFSVQQAERVPVWKAMVEELEQDATKKNPYEMVVNGLTERQVHLQFMEEEANEAKEGVPPRHKVSASTFMMEGLGIEDEQRRVRVQAELKKAQTTAQQINMGAMRNKLNRRLARFRQLQATYMPAAIVDLARHNAAQEELAEDVPNVIWDASLGSMASKIHCVMPSAGALVRLRNQLHVKARLINYKRIHARHQGPNMRVRTVVARNESKIRLHSEKYQAGWKARLALARGDTSKVGRQRLRKEDIRLMEDAEELSKKAEKEHARAERRRQKEAELRASGEMVPEEEVSEEEQEVEEGEQEQRMRGRENRRQLSWIWTSTGTTGTDAELEDALRIEWAKAYTRVRRWREEVRLLKEEFRHVPLLLEYEGAVWQARAGIVDISSMSLAVAQGLIAYAACQEAMYVGLAARARTTEMEPKTMRGRKRQAPRVRVREQDVSESEEEEGKDMDDEDEEDDWGHCQRREDLTKICTRKIKSKHKFY